LRQAIDTAVNGDTVLFAPSLPTPINLTGGALAINKFLLIQGPGAAKLTVSGQNATQVLHVGGQAIISGLTFADGMFAGSVGGNGTDNTGAAGDPGGGAGGACVRISAGGTLVLDHVAVHHCVARGGHGGNGGSGIPGSIDPMNPIFAGPGGTGGVGGEARGAAILVYGSLSLLNSSVVDGEAYGGDGGAGGSGGFDFSVTAFGGNGGAGGLADGGAVYAASGTTLRIANATLAESVATGGGGGSPGLLFFPGTPGNGGNADGGLVRIAGSAALADIEFSTLANGHVTGGLGGTGGIIGGMDGTMLGNAISTVANTNVLSSVIVGAQAGAEVCDGNVTAAGGSSNLSEDTSCAGFTLHQTFAQVFHPLNVNTTPWPGYVPLYKGAPIDAAQTCNDLATQVVASDQHDTYRPQGAKCDLGAIEADYIFVDGFE